MTTLKVWKTNPQNQVPKKATEGSACFDLQFQGHGKREYKGYSRMNKAFTRPMNNMIVIQPGDRVMVPTGLILDIPEGYSVRVHARSGLSLKQGLILANSEGVIDSDYVEELMVLLWNISDNAINIYTGDRIAQAELVKDEEYNILMVATRPLPKSNRIGGMGSTGIKDEGDTITLSISEPKVPDFVKTPEKRGRGRPKKNVSAA